VPRTDLLSASARAGALRLTNLSNETVYYAVAERETWNLIDIYVCDDPATCTSPRLPAGESVDVPYEQISGYERGAEAIVMHWHLVERPGEGRYVPDEMRRLSVVLR
jgi:hypothetical protein